MNNESSTQDAEIALYPAWIVFADVFILLLEES